MRPFGKFFFPTRMCLFPVNKQQGLVTLAFFFLTLTTNRNEVSWPFSRSHFFAEIFAVVRVEKKIPNYRLGEKNLKNPKLIDLTLK